MRVYYECREEIKEQLGLSLLMNKITFLQKCMNVVFEEHQFRAIYLQQKPNVKEAEEFRKNHGLNKIIHRNSNKIHNKIQDKLKQHQQKLIKRLKNSQENTQKNKNENRMSGQVKSTLPIDLKQIIANFAMLDTHKLQENDRRERPIDVISQKIQLQRQNVSQTQQYIQPEEIAGQNHQSLQFINTALMDIAKVEEQSKRGNIFSQRIYNQLNNDITKEQLIILKCLQTILANKMPADKESIKDGPDQIIESIKEKQRPRKQSRKKTLFHSLMKLTALNFAEQNNNNEQEQRPGLEIILESNGRIETRQDI